MEEVWRDGLEPTGLCLDVVLMWQAWPLFFLIRNQCLQQCGIPSYNAYAEERLSQCASVSSCIWSWLAYHHLATTLFPVYRCLGAERFALYFDALMKALRWDIALLTSGLLDCILRHPVFIPACIIICEVSPLKESKDETP